MGTEHIEFEAERGKPVAWSDWEEPWSKLYDHHQRKQVKGIRKIPVHHTILSMQPRPDTSHACWNCCSKPVRSCSPVLIPRRHVRSGVPNPWDTAAPSWYLVGMHGLVFRAREILQPDLIPRRHVRSGVPNPWDPAAPTRYLVGMLNLLFRTLDVLQPCPDTS